MADINISFESEKEVSLLKRRRIVAYIVLSLVTVMCLFWFYVLIIYTTRSNDEMGRGFSMIPSTYLFKNFKSIFTGSSPVIRGMINSIIVAGSAAILCTYFSSMTAYAVHVYNFKGRKAVHTFILAIMMIPAQVSALGFIRLVDKLHMTNTLWPLILPSICVPVTYFYMKQYMESAIPLELVEAARIDGAGEFRTFNTIVLPLMKPSIAVQAIFTFVSSWNNYFTPALIIDKPEMKTLPILIAELRKADYAKFDMGAVYAMILFSIAPVVVVYLVLSKNIVGGVAAGSVKG